MIVRRYCEQCGELVDMEVKSAFPHRHFCDDCRRKRAVQATLRYRHKYKASRDGYTETRTVRFRFSKHGALLGMEVLDDG